MKPTTFLRIWLLIFSSGAHGPVSSSGVIVSKRLLTDSRSLISISEPFGFSSGGLAEFWISKVDVSGKMTRKIVQHRKTDAKKSKLKGWKPKMSTKHSIGFLLAPPRLGKEIWANNTIQQRLQRERRWMRRHKAEGSKITGISPRNPVPDPDCALSDPRVTTLFFLPLSPEKFTDGVYTHSWSSPRGSLGEYEIFFVNCQELAVVNFTLTVKLTNSAGPYSGAGVSRSHLSAERMVLPALYDKAFVLYIITCLGWTSVIYVRRGYASAIHGAMAGLLFLKSMSVLSQANSVHTMEVTGDFGTGIGIYVLLTTLRGIFLAAICVFIFVGWSFLKPYLPDREKILLPVVIALQLGANLLKIILEEQSMSFSPWHTLLYLIDLLCLCAILLPIGMLMRRPFVHPPVQRSNQPYWQSAGETYTLEEKDSLLKQKLQQFRTLYLIFVSFEFLPRLLGHLWVTYSPYETRWRVHFLREFVVYFFYCVIGWLIRPDVNNPYLASKTKDLFIVNQRATAVHSLWQVHSTDTKTSSVFGTWKMFKKSPQQDVQPFNATFIRTF
ncbi:hypothetical protein CYMTET_13205 [Cymbomonas tetramitiformis]|uniref:GOST seven transmembrane domain-containing protein n=1 Tax=Cymbomonas tetramitiformis TaxID=36881 RepID=A0AAE0GIX7_9CHLO|nr:hypothetical protein CYMTET_13205 [Cymbomonas tetramitiformis]